VDALDALEEELEAVEVTVVVSEATVEVVEDVTGAEVEDEAEEELTSPPEIVNSML
jgi:hypothetical protein